MRKLYFGLVILSSCGTLPQFYQTIDDIATDDAIKISVDKDAFKKDTDVHVSVDVINKDMGSLP